MGQFISKNSKRKFGLQPGYTPKLMPEPTKEAIVPMIQRDGSIKYVSQHDFEWMIKMGHVENSQKS